MCVCLCVFFRVFLVLVDSIFALAPSRMKFVTFFIMIFASLSLCVNVLLFNGCYLYYIKLELGLLFFFLCTATVIVCSCLCFISVDITH